MAAASQGEVRSRDFRQKSHQSESKDVPGKKETRIAKRIGLEGRHE